MPAQPSSLSVNLPASPLATMTSSRVSLDPEEPGADGTAALAAGTLLNGRYRLERVLGEGGMGVVYRAFDGLLARPVAVKTIRGNIIRSDQLSMFKAEFKVMSELRHPNVAEVYDFETDAASGDHFFTMELIDGVPALEGTLDLAFGAITDVLVGVCRALSYIHDHNVIHFDLKPGNVLVGAGARTKVLDFGLVGARARIGKQGVCGTPAYMAPEVIRGGVIDHRADLYSLGVVAFQILCRRLPFPGGSVSDICAWHLGGTATFTGAEEERLPAWLRAMVLRLLQKEPRHRYRNANAVVQAINRGAGLTYELATADTKESYIVSSRLIARDDQLRELVGAALARGEGKAGARPLWLVSGHSGVGKSRLMREVRHELQLGRLTFVEASCYESAPTELGSISEILRHLVALAQSVGARELIAAYAPDLLRLLPSLAREWRLAPSPALPDARDEELRLIGQVTEFIVRLSERVPLTLFVNDLQWASPSVIRVLVALLRRIEAAEEQVACVRVTVFGTYRDDEVEGRPLRELIEIAETLGLLGSARLDPLEPRDVARLLCSMLGVEELPESFTARVCDSTGGNPFLVEEVMRALVENGSVFLVDGKWAAVDSVEQLDIPAGVAAVFLRRAANLDPACKTTLDMLVVSGALTPLATLAATTELPGPELDRALALLQTRQMAVTVSPGVYRVAHDWIREAVYAAIPEERRRDLHARLARTLAQSDDTLERGELLAHHLARAGALEEAIAVGRAAAERADGARLFALALGLYERVADWLEQLSASNRRGERLECLIAAARQSEFIGERGRHSQIVARLRALADEGLSERERITVNVCHAGYLTSQHRFTEAQAVLDDAMALCLPLGDRLLERDLLRNLGHVCWQAGTYDRVTTINERILVLDRELGDQRGYIVDLGHLASGLRGIGELDRAVATAEEAVRGARATGDVRLQGQAITVLASIYGELGRLDLREQALLDLDYREFPAHDAVRYAILGGTRWRLGRIRESIAAYDQAVTLARQAHVLPELARCLRSLGELHAVAGNLRAAFGCVLECATVCAHMGETANEAAALFRAAELQQELPGGAPRARAVLVKVIALARRAQNLALAIRAHEALADLAKADDPDDAEQHYLQALRLAEPTGDDAKRADLLNSLGILAWKRRDYRVALGRYREALAFIPGDAHAHAALLHNSVGATLRALEDEGPALEAFERGLACGEQAGDRLLQAHALSGIADLCTRRGDRARAIECYRRSLALRDGAKDGKGAAWTAHKLAALDVLDREALLARAETFAAHADEALAAACRELRARTRTRA